MSKVTENAVGKAFRTAAGLPPRESDKPITNTAEVSEARLSTEPEGGYGGKDGVPNTAAINASEQAHVERQQAAAAEAEGEDLTGGETATEVARVTGEDTPDVKPAGDAEDAAPAKPKSKSKAK